MSLCKARSLQTGAHEASFDASVNFIPDAARYPVFADVILVNHYDRITRKNEGK